MEPSSIVNNNNVPNPQPLPAPPAPTWRQSLLISLAGNWFTVKPVAQNEGLQGKEVVDKTKVLHTLFSDLPNVLFQTNTFQKIILEHQVVVEKLEIKNCLEELFKIIFLKLSVDPDIDYNMISILPKYRFNDFINNLTKIVNRHLSNLPEGNDEQAKNGKKDAFKALARELLETAFPNKENDEHLPGVLKSILKRDVWARAISVMVPMIDDFTWDKLIRNIRRIWGEILR